MTIGESSAPVGSRGPRDAYDFGDGANLSPRGNAPQAAPQKRTPRKWQRILSAFLTGRSFNRFEASRELHDTCLNSTVSEIQDRGVPISRKTESVPGYQNIPTVVCRYWLDFTNSEAIARARQLVGKVDA